MLTHRGNDLNLVVKHERSRSLWHWRRNTKHLLNKHMTDVFVFVYGMLIILDSSFHALLRFKRHLALNLLPPLCFSVSSMQLLWWSCPQTNVCFMWLQNSSDFFPSSVLKFNVQVSEQCFFFIGPCLKKLTWCSVLDTVWWVTVTPVSPENHCTQVDVMNLFVFRCKFLWVSDCASYSYASPWTSWPLLQMWFSSCLVACGYSCSLSHLQAPQSGLLHVVGWSPHGSHVVLGQRWCSVSCSQL